MLIAAKMLILYYLLMTSFLKTIDRYLLRLDLKLKIAGSNLTKSIFVIQNTAETFV